MNGPVPSKYPLAPVSPWRTRENGGSRGRRRGSMKNSNVPTAGHARGSRFVALPKAAAEQIFSPVSRLFRRDAEGARKPFAVMRPDFGIDDPRRTFAVERVKHL